MATVTGLTAARMAEIEAAAIVAAEVVDDELFLTTHGQGVINAGNVRGESGQPGTTDHGLLIGLSDDDHPQYLTTGRADALYLGLGDAPTTHASSHAGAGSDAITSLGAVTHTGDLTLGTGVQLDFYDEEGDKLYLWSNTFGIGIESSTLTNWSTQFRWRVGGTSVSTGTEKMLLTGTGLGIGTTAPARKLHVGSAALNVNSDANSDIISSTGITIAGNYKLTLDNAYGVHSNLWFAYDGTEYATKIQGHYGIQFLTRSATNAGVIRGDTGYWGVGNVTAPSAQLTVQGAATNLQEWRNNYGLLRLGVANDGLVTGYLSDGVSSAWFLHNNDTAGRRAGFGAHDTGTIPLYVWGSYAGQVANLTEWHAYDGGALLSSVGPQGNFGVGHVPSASYKIWSYAGNETALRLDANAGYLALSVGGTGIVGVDSPGVSFGRFIITDTGNVGIGLDTPLAGLDVGYKASIPGLQTQQGGSGYPAIGLGWYGSASSYRHAIYTSHDGGSNAGNHMDFYLWQTGQSGDAFGSKLAFRIGATGNISYVPLDMGSQKITSLATPTTSTDAATKAYVDGLSPEVNDGYAPAKVAGVQAWPAVKTMAVQWDPVILNAHGDPATDMGPGSGQYRVQVSLAVGHSGIITTGSWATTAPVNVNATTTSLKQIFYANLTDYTPGSDYVLGGYGSTLLIVTADARFYAQAYDAANAYHYAYCGSHGLSDGVGAWIGWEINPITKKVSFYKSSNALSNHPGISFDGSGWTAITEDVTFSSAWDGTFHSNSYAYASYPGNPAPGKIYRAEGWIDGAQVWGVNFSKGVAGASSLTGDKGETWNGTSQVVAFDSISFTSPIRTKVVTGNFASIADLSAGLAYAIRVRAEDPYDMVGEWSDTVTARTSEVTLGELAYESIRAENISTDAIRTEHLYAGAVTAENLESNLVLVNQTISSASFTSLTGWQIRSDGGADFNGGTLSVKDGTGKTWITGGAINTNAITVSTLDPTTKDYIKDGYGFNKVQNGFGYMGNLTNFTQFDLINAGDIPGSGFGSFQIETTYSYEGALTDEYIPIDSGKTYELGYWARISDDNGYGGEVRLYGFVVSYDMDGNGIYPANFTKMPGSETTLAADLNPSDTTITLTSSSGWSNHDASYQRLISFYPYRSSSGYVYDDWTYTRWAAQVECWADGGINTGTHVITLKDTAQNLGLMMNPDTVDGHWPSGTKVANTMHGGTFDYIAGKASRYDGGDWVYFSGMQRPPATLAEERGELWSWYENIRRPGTAFQQIGWLFGVADINRTFTSQIANVTFSEVIGSSLIEPSAITTVKIADGAVTAGKLTAAMILGTQYIQLGAGSPSSLPTTSIHSGNWSNQSAGFLLNGDGSAQFSGTLWVGGATTIKGNVTVGSSSLGFLKSSTYSGTTIPTGIATAGWMLWNNGEAEFASNTWVKGSLIVGGASNNQGLIKSHGYSAGVSGWQVNYDGSAEFRNITARGDIQASSVTAGAVTAAGIAAGAVTAEKLTVSSYGDCAILNGNFEEASAADATMAAGWTWGGWNGTGTRGVSEDAVLSTTSPLSGSQSMKLTGNVPSIRTVTAIPVVVGDKWYVSITCKNPAGAVAGGVYVRFMDQNGAEMTDLGIENKAVGTGKTVLEGTGTIPSGVTTVRLFILWYGPVAGTTTGFYVDDVIVRKATGSVQIVDGAITAAKLTSTLALVGKIESSSPAYVAGTSGFQIDGATGNADLSGSLTLGGNITAGLGADILGIDGTFESTPNWMTQSNTVARTGTYSGRVSTPAGESFSWQTLTKTNPNSSRDTWYKVSGYWRGGTTNVVGWIWENNGKAIVKKFPDTTTWYPFTFFAKVVAGGNLVLKASAISSNGATADQYVYFDDVTAKPVGAFINDWVIESGSIVGSDGLTHTLNKVGVRVYSSIDFTHDSTGNWLSVSFDTSVSDYDSLWSSANPKRVVIAETGWYSLTANVIFAAKTGGIRMIRICKNGKNGAGTVLTQQTNLNVSGTNSSHINVSHIEYLTVGDYVVLDVYQNSGANLACSNSGTWAPSLSVVKLS